MADGIEAALRMLRKAMPILAQSFGIEEVHRSIERVVEANGLPYRKDRARYILPETA